MEKVTNLQELINKRAEARLDAEFDKIMSFLSGNKLLGSKPHDVPYLYTKKEDRYFENRPLWAFNKNEPYGKLLKEFWLPIFIKEETENFMKKVDELDSEVQALKNIQYADEF
jgi:hypothetical protein